MTKLSNMERLAVIEERIETLRDLNEKEFKEIKEILKDMDNKYVSKQEFIPIKSIVYGGTGLILTTVVLAIVYLVII